MTDNRNLPALSPTEHAELGASNAHRWIACAGSVRMSRGVPNVETDFSREGTAAHKLATLGLQRGLMEGLPREIDGFDTADMIDPVTMFVEFCLNIMVQTKGMHWIERKFSLAQLNPPAPMFGTADFAGYIPDIRRLHVVDLKYGQGVVVEVFENEQTMYYALGVVLDLFEQYPGMEIDEIELTIIQPRAGHADGPVRSWTLTVSELLDFAVMLLEAAQRTQDPNAPLTPGPHCRFCPAATFCPAHKEQVEALIKTEFHSLDEGTHAPPLPQSLPAAELGFMMTKLPILETWISAMKTETRARLEAGEEVPGVKLVPTQPRRHWIDEELAVKTLGTVMDEDDLYSKKLKSPNQVEQVLGKKAFKQLAPDLVEKVSSGYTVALASDARPAVVLNPGSEFEGTLPNEQQQLLPRNRDEEI